MTTTAASPFLFDAVEPQYVAGPGARYAYWRFGKTGAPPLVMWTRFRGTIDHWDPALLDLLAAEREVITFDNAGTASSTGSAPTTFQRLGDGALRFIDAPEKTWKIAPKPVLEDEDYLYLFFPKTEAARAVGLASLRRLDYGLDRSPGEVLPDQLKAQITAIQGNKGLWDRVPELEHPVLVATGAHAR